MKKLFIIIILALIPGLLMAEGAVITEVVKSIGGSHTGMYTLTLAWTSDSETGAVEAATSTDITAWLEEMDHVKDRTRDRRRCSDSGL